MAADTSCRAISSRTMAASTSPIPRPPHSSPMVTRNRSAAAMAAMASRGTSPDSSYPAPPGATGRPPEVVGEPEGAPALGDRGDLALQRGLAAQLQPALEQHPQPRGADGV